MPDITRGYTFTDSKADWASEKETALRLNKMIDDAKVNLVAGTNVTINRGSSGITINSTASGGTGTVTSIDVDGGTGISVSPAGPITTSGTFVVTNTAPDRTVALTGAGTTTVTGTYPNFTVSSADAYTGTVTGVSVATANGISGTVANPTTTPAITLTLGAIVPTSVNSVTLSGSSTPSLSVTGTSSISGSHSGTSSGINTGDQTITLTGDVTGSGTGSFAATIANGAVSNAKLANVATSTFKGRTTAGVGSPEDLTATQATALLNSFSSTLKGLAPASGGGTTNFLRADGSWAAPAGGGTGTVTSVSVVTANGVSGTVANPTTTPAITLSLGDISAATSKPSSTGSVVRSFASRERDVFNVKDFGAVGDGITNDNSAIALAITALQAYSSGTTRGTLYFPDGTYLISSAISITLSNGFCATIRGNGRYSSIILQTTAGANGITATMTAASTAERCIEICDLGFVVADNVVSGTAISIDYGSTPTQSSDAGNGSVVTRVSINTKSYAGGSNPSGGFYQGGWTSGVVIRNGWKSFISDVSGVGRASLAASGSIPTSGSGSGSFIEISGGQNVHISDVSGMFWQYGLNFTQSPTGTIGGTAVCINFILNVIGIGVRFAPTTFYGHSQFSNFIIDQGNSANSGYANIAFLFDTNTRFSYVVEGVTYYTPGGYIGIATGFITQIAGSTGAFEIKGYNQYGIVTGVVMFAGTSFLHMYNNTNSWIFNGNQTGGCSITFDLGSNYNQINCTGGSAITDNGAGNATKVTLW